MPARTEPTVVIRRSARRQRTVTAYRKEDTIVVLVPQRMSSLDEQRYVAELVSKVLAREAKLAARASAPDLAERARSLLTTYLDPYDTRSRPPSSVVWVGNQQRRWGSCTPGTGSIRLSDRLQPMPSWVVDYVLLHELAHLIERTHSAAFYRLVDRYPRSERAQGFLAGYLSARSNEWTDQHCVDDLGPDDRAG